MIQSMKILQLPISVLKERIEQEMRENSLLDEPVVEFETPEATTDGAAGDADDSPDPPAG
jgi:hypothetical protein